MKEIKSLCISILLLLGNIIITASSGEIYTVTLPLSFYAVANCLLFYCKVYMYVVGVVFTP